MFVSKQDRVLNLILIGCNMYLTEEYQRISKINHGDILESNKNIRNFELCKFPCVHLTHSRPIGLKTTSYYSYTVTAHRCAAHYRDKVPLIVIQ